MLSWWICELPYWSVCWKVPGEGYVSGISLGHERRHSLPQYSAAWHACVSRQCSFQTRNGLKHEFLSGMIIDTAATCILWTVYEPVASGCNCSPWPVVRRCSIIRKKAMLGKLKSRPAATEFSCRCHITDCVHFRCFAGSVHGDIGGGRDEI